MNQATVVLILAAIAIFLYSFGIVRGGRRLDADALLVVGTRCGGGAVGIYMLLWALKLVRQSDPEMTRVYVGIFGVIFAVWSFQKPYEMIKGVITKKQVQPKHK